MIKAFHAAKAYSVRVLQKRGKADQEENMTNSMNEQMEREIREAVGAGERALYSLNAARDQLQSAGNWGLFWRRIYHRYDEAFQNRQGSLLYGECKAVSGGVSAGASGCFHPHRSRYGDWRLFDLCRFFL